MKETEMGCNDTDGTQPAKDDDFVLFGQRVPMSISDDDLRDHILDRRLEITLDEAKRRRDSNVKPPSNRPEPGAFPLADMGRRPRGRRHFFAD
jgi:hypothetical protein